MKKLLYLLPLLFIGLSALPISLYKDKVDFLLSKNPNAQVDDIEGALTKLSPSHWKMIDFQTSVNVNFSSVSFSLGSEGNPTNTTDNQTQDLSKSEPIYKWATFRGFPFAAYFSKDNSSNTAIGYFSVSASGYSWLWAAADVLLIFGALVLSFMVNRKSKEVTPVAAQPFANPNVITSATPQADGIQTGVFTPNQSPQQPTQPPNHTTPQPPQPPQITPQV